MYPVIHIVIPSYAFFAVLGGLVIMTFLFFRIDKYEFPFSDYLKLLATCVLYGFIGSRLVFIFSKLPWLVLNFSLKNVLNTVLGGGIVFYGGLLGVLFGVYRYAKKHGYDSSKLYNMVAPAIPLFHSFGRIGCFMAGCCYGFELPTSFSFFGITIDKFPTQLVEAVFEFILFVVIYTYQKKREEANCLRIYLLSYATFRFIIEFMRGDAARGLFFGVSTSQLISLAIILFYLVSFVFNKRKACEPCSEE